MLSSPSDDEVGGFQRAIRARDVRAADLQEETTKRLENSADPLTQSFRRIRRRRRLPGEHRSERSEPLDRASAASGAIKPDRPRCRAEEERGDMLSSPSDDEVGGFQRAIRAERAQRAEQSNTCEGN
jgi:hypothetical protein